MDNSTHMGRNRTGIDMSPIHSKAMIDAAQSYPPDPLKGDGVAAIEREYIQNAESFGSVPMPGTVKGVMKSAMGKMTGDNSEVLINKLGERLAYERSGVRIYDCFIFKCESTPGKAQRELQIPLEQVRQFRDEEAKHFQMLKACMEELGADPTAQTPDADVSSLASAGLMKVIMDPRTNISQSLEALLSIELTDHASWELLIKLANDFGMDKMADKFRGALQEEENHLQNVRQWYEHSVLAEA